MLVMDRLNALDERVMPVVVAPMKAFAGRHPVAVRRAPLVTLILLVTLTMLDLAVRHPKNPVSLVILMALPVSQLARSVRTDTTSRVAIWVLALVLVLAAFFALIVLFVAIMPVDQHWSGSR